MKKLIKIIMVFAVIFTVNAQVLAQDTVSVQKTKVEGFINFDLVSGYVWRGTMLDTKPNIQPVFGASYGGFTLGVFNSVSVINSYYETDIFASYAIGNFVTISVTDFYVDLDPTISQSYTNYSDTAGYHNVVADVIFGNAEKFPFLFTASVITYGGLDLNENGKQNYTGYFELKYIHNNYEIFAGALTGQSDFYLNNGAGIVNVGAKFNKEIKVTDKFTVPVGMALITNPQMEKVYVVLSLSF